MESLEVGLGAIGGEERDCFIALWCCYLQRQKRGRWGFERPETGESGQIFTVK